MAALTVVFASFSSVAIAEVTVRVQPDQIEPEIANVTVTIRGDDAGDQILLSLSEGLVKVNGADPPSGSVSFANLTHLGVDGGGGADVIDLRGMVGLAEHSEYLSGGGIQIFGGAGNDQIWGPTFSREEADADSGRGLGIYVQMHGGRGSDRIRGTLDADAVYGDLGADFLYGGDGMDMISGGPGNDRIWGQDNGTFTANPDKQEQIYGNAGDDVIFGGAGNDEILGQDGEDRISGGPGRDVMYQNTKSRRGLPECRHEPPGYCNPIIS